MEALEGALVVGAGVGEELEGHGLREREVGGAVDFSHAAAAERRSPWLVVSGWWLVVVFEQSNPK